MGFFDKIGDGLASIDPTTKEGLINLATGGLIGGAADPDSALQSLDDQISGQDQKEAAKDAAEAQETAARESLVLQERIYNEGQAKLDPFYQGGLGSLDDYLNLNSSEGSSKFKTDYLGGDEFASFLDQGLDSLESRAAYSGALGSGGTLKNVGKYVTDTSFDLSNQALASELGRLGSNVGLGQSAAGAQITAGQNFGQQAGQTYGRIGDAQATRELAGAPTGIAPYLNIAGTGAKIYGATV